MAPLKRKRAPRELISADTLAVFAMSLKQRPNELSLLLDLPAEMRNAIYMMVLKDYPVQLSRLSHKKTLATRSTLLRVNKQVYNELSSAALLAADIHTTAHNFDFGHLVAFVNRLSEAELQALPGLNTPAVRRITIKLHIWDADYLSPPELQRLAPPQLQRWINRAGHPTKKGTNLDFVYKLVASAQFAYMKANGYYPHLTRPKPRVPWDHLRLEDMVEGRKKEEYVKILTALGY